MKKSEAAKEYLKTVHVPLIDTENVEAMLYNMRMMAFSAGHDAGVRYAIEQASKLVHEKDLTRIKYIQKLNNLLESTP